MRLSLVLLAFAITLLSSCDAAPATASLLQVEPPTEGAAFNQNSGNRLLRTQETTNAANDNEAGVEERIWGLKNLLSLVKLNKINDFAKKDLDRMLTDPAFKLEMFKRWNKHSTEKVMAALDLSKRKNAPYGPMLQEFLNTYRLRPGASAVRAGN
ncbi:hypothetical protein PF011_g22649 [Phytophthora fragariae]|uniref:RxLR effector protein n=2 Tax=Phytophthora fragariae TaxID=53985 RepID=A0A6A3IA96_9STRA|nr:hypothetical protein PF011_g22649 [Phytophthora fragariae]KAE9298560.1 hypothetical protein PF008_g23468 [Phytophthora fragariae]